MTETEEDRRSALMQRYLHLLNNYDEVDEDTVSGTIVNFVEQISYDCSPNWGGVDRNAVREAWACADLQMALERLMPKEPGDAN